MHIVDRAAPSNMCLSRKYRGSVSVIERPGWSGKPIDDLRAIVAVLVFGAG